MEITERVEIQVLDDADNRQWYAVYAASNARSFVAPWLEVEKKVNLTDDDYATKVVLAC